MTLHEAAFSIECNAQECIALPNKVAKLESRANGGTYATTRGCLDALVPFAGPVGEATPQI